MAFLLLVILMHSHRHFWDKMWTVLLICFAPNMIFFLAHNLNWCFIRKNMPLPVWNIPSETAYGPFPPLQKIRSTNDDSFSKCSPAIFHTFQFLVFSSSMEGCGPGISLLKFGNDRLFSSCRVPFNDRRQWSGVPLSPFWSPVNIIYPIIFSSSSVPTFFQNVLRFTPGLSWKSLQLISRLYLVVPWDFLSLVVYTLTSWTI